jgi:hypothetical protein
VTELESTKIVMMLTAAYPSWKPGKESLQLYAKLLEPFDGDLGKKTVMEMLYSPREFAPPIGVVAEAILIAKMKAEGQYLSPEDAWAEVMQQIRHAGYYRQPKFSSAALSRAVEAIDWKELCSNDNVEATRAHLMRIHDAMQKREVRENMVTLLGANLAAQVMGESPKQVE